MRGMLKTTALACTNEITTAFILSLAIWGSMPNMVKAQSGQQAVNAPKFGVDPFWPKPLQNRWVTVEVGAVCVDAQDHVFIATRGNLTPKEHNMATVTPPMIEF